VILDEPFSGLDPINAQALKDAVLELKRRGKTVIFSTHVMDNAEKMCDSVCIIARGVKVLDGGVAAVKRGAGARYVALSLVGGAQNGVGAVLRDPQLVRKLDDNTNYIELELTASADPQVLLRRLLEAGANIERFELVQPSLHQIFLERVGATGIETGMSGHG
jgi:ABC-2 type transport system ATP-binding protein